MKQAAGAHENGEQQEAKTQSFEIKTLTFTNDDQLLICPMTLRLIAI